MGTYWTAHLNNINIIVDNNGGRKNVNSADDKNTWLS